MAKTKWNEWKSDRDNPKSGKEIFIKLKNDTLGIGGFVFALFVDRLNGYIMLTYQISGNTMQTFCTHNYFTKGDKWIYVEDLKNIEFIVMAKTIKDLAEEKYPVSDDAWMHNAYIDGANAVLEAVKEELMRVFMNNLGEFTEHDRDIAQDVLDQISMFLNQLKGE